MKQRPSHHARWLIMTAMLIAATIGASAGCLEKITGRIAPIWYTNEPTSLEFDLENKNASFSLGETFWSVEYKNSDGMVIHTESGSKEVGTEDKQTITTEEYMFLGAGFYDIVIKANSEANICGEQELVVGIEVMDAPKCTTAPSRSPGGALVMNMGNTITYTAPDGCCFTIDPFINTGVWYSLSPSTTQTISDGESVTFTVTPKDPNAPASLVAFEWTECSDPEFSGKEYIVITPSIPSPDSGGTPPHGPGILVGEFGDPVSVTGGNFFRSETDIDNPSVRQLSFGRHYDSRFLDNGVIPSMGINWLHSFSATVQLFESTAVVQLEDGRRVYFSQSGNKWLVNPGSENQAYRHGQLSQNGDEYTYTDIVRKTQYSFNADGRLKKVDDGYVPIYIEWNGADIVSAVDSLGNRLDFTTDTLSRITGVTNGIASASYTYSNGSELMSASRVGLATLDYVYDPTIVGQLRNIRSEGKPLLSNQYDPEHRVLSQTDAEGGLWEYAYAAGSSRITDPDLVATTYNFTSTGKLSGYGIAPTFTSIVYNSSNQLESITDREGNIVTYTWDDNGLVKSITDADGTESYEYTSRTFGDATVYDVSKKTHADGSSTSFSYDDRGRVVKLVDEEGGETQFGIDARTGKVTTVTGPAGAITTREYETNGHLSAYSPIPGVRTTVMTNAGGFITAENNADATARTSVLNTFGGATEFIDASGAQTVTEYNDRGLISKRTFANGGVSTFTYDNEGRLTQIKKPSGDTYSVEYSQSGRIVSVHDAGNNAVSFEYNRDGHRTTKTNSLGKETTYGYDKDNQLVSETSPKGHTTRVNRDGMGRITGLTTASGKASSMSYDSRGRVAKITDGSGRTVAFDHNKTGQVVTQTIGKNISASFEHDAAGNTTAITDPMGGTVAYARDASGRITSVTDQANRITAYTYDNRGRAATVAIPGSQPASMKYDGENRLTEIAYADGTSFNYNINALGQVTSTKGDSVVFDVDGRTEWSNGIAVTRVNGNLATYSFDGNGLSVSYEYDEANQCTAIVDHNGGRMEMSYDDDGHLISVSRPNGVTTTYTYDTDGNVTSINEGSATSIALTYDNGGRIVQSERTGFLPATTPMDVWSGTYDASNVRTDEVADAAGRAATVSGANITWNDASQLKSLSGSVAATFEYDGFGRVTAMTVGLDTTDLIWNDHFGDGTIGFVRTASAGLFVVPNPYGQIAFVIDVASNEVYYPHYTASGNTHAVSNGSGEIKAQYDYAPYGMLIASRNELSFEYPFLFGGASGTVVPVTANLYATTSRMYDAQAARFLSHDPVRSHHPQSMNSFQYANQDPVNQQDWTGRAPGETPAADDPYADFSPEFRARMREIQETYERETARIEAEHQERMRELDERDRRDRASRERLEREAAERAEEQRKDDQALSDAQRKVAELNETFAPMPRYPDPEPTPEPTGEGESTPGAGETGTNPGSSGETPSSGGTRTRPSPPPAPPTPPAPTPTPPGGTPGGNRGSGSGADYGTYDSGGIGFIRTLGAYGSGFLDGLNWETFRGYYFD